MGPYNCAAVPVWADGADGVDGVDGVDGADGAEVGIANLARSWPASCPMAASASAESRVKLRT